VIEDQKRGRIELDKGQRDTVLRFILASHLHITSLLLSSELKDYTTNLHVSQQVTSIFTTIHNCLRQEALVTGSLRTTMKDNDHQLVSGGKAIGKKLAHSALCKAVKEMASSFMIPYNKPNKDDTNHWYGTA